MASWKRPTRPFRSPTMRPSIWRLDELAKVEVRLRLAGSIRVQRRDRKLVGRWVGSYETDDLGSPWVFGPTKTGWVNFLWSMNLWIYELYMKHQVYRCLLAKLKGKERVFKRICASGLMSQVFPMPPVKLLGIPRKSHMNMPCRIRGFNRILERCSYGPPLSSGFVGQILGLPHWGPTGN